MAECRGKRERDHILAFTMSPEESELLDRKANLAGCLKQSYVLSCIFREPITVCGTPQVYRRLALQLEQILAALKSETVEEARDMTLTTIQFIARLYGMLSQE